jgi:hypothetical protein
LGGVLESITKGAHFVLQLMTLTLVVCFTSYREIFTHMKNLPATVEDDVPLITIPYAYKRFFQLFSKMSRFTRSHQGKFKPIIHVFDIPFT